MVSRSILHYLTSIIINLPLRYSGSDIAIVVRDALMQPVRKVISATHFKRMPAEDGSSAIKWTPCSPGDADAVEKTWSDIESDELLEPPLTMKDFVKSLESVRPTVSAEDIKKHDEWTKESGTFPLAWPNMLMFHVLILDVQAMMGRDRRSIVVLLL